MAAEPSDAPEGGCACGAVRYRISGKPRHACYCHCSSCRAACGAPFVAWGTIRRDQFRIISGNPALRRSSEKVERGFCGSCGTCLTYQHDKTRDYLDFTLATLDEPGVIAPEFHIWVSEKLPWVSINDGLPAYEGWRE